ncbi:MAG: FAD-dependent oxidoreductase, partial [Candidatus Eremiobacteraeota bacterium]|nr:FAD-dependent oxidoreductase [Candidatus Eremiobacteraeota bacterium]
NVNWFDIETLPERLAVIGGGYIGLELGQGAQRLGSRVTICTSGEKLMPSEDEDAVEVVRRALERDGVAFQLDCKTTSVRHDGTTFVLGFDNGTSLEADALLVTAGRTPNTDGLNVAASGVRLDNAGFVAVDDVLQSACPGVYAIGDVARQPAFTHVSWEDFRRLRSTFSGTPRKRDDRVLSYTTFTEPQLARTGLTEREARGAGRNVKTQTLALGDVARGEEWNLSDGFYRLVVDANSDALVGATLVGYEAGEIIHALALAIQLGATRHQLDDFMAIHPTFSEGLPSLARMFES